MDIQIRNKRLAKLGNQSQAQNSPQESTAPSSNPPKQPADSEPADQNATKPKINITSVQAPQQDPSNPFTQLGLKPTKGNSSRESNISPSQAPGSLKRNRASESNGASSSETMEGWEDRTLSSVFRLTLEPDKKQDHLGNKLYYAEGVRKELEEEKAPLRLNLTVLEQGILEAGSKTGKLSPFDYMLSCWKRISKQLKNLKARPDEAKLTIIREARRICMSYCIFAVTMAEMFGRDNPKSSPLVPHLIVDSEDDQGLCPEFLQEITSRFAEDEAAQEAMVSAVEELSQDLAKMSMNDNYKPYLMVSQYCKWTMDLLILEGAAKTCQIPFHGERIGSVASFFTV